MVRRLRPDTPRRWSQGRIALLGDAAWAAGPGGGGTGMAMTGAYVPAGELAANRDHVTAFTRYEATLCKATTGGQKQARNTGPFFAPPTAAKIRQRNRAYRALLSRPLLPVFGWLSERTANAVRLKAYPADGPVVTATP